MNIIPTAPLPLPPTSINNSSTITTTPTTNNAPTTIQIQQQHSEKKRANRKLTKADIGMPTNFKHLTHVGWSAQRGFDLTGDDVETLKPFLEKAGVSDQQLKDRETRAFIYDFIQNHNVLESVKSESDPAKVPPPIVHHIKGGQAPPPPPPVPTRNQPQSNGSSQQQQQQQRIAPPPPPPPTRQQAPPPPLPTTTPPSRGPPPSRPPPITMSIPPPPTIVQSISSQPPPPPPPPMMMAMPQPPPPPVANFIDSIPTKSSANVTDGRSGGGDSMDNRSALMDSIRKGKALKVIMNRLSDFFCLFIRLLVGCISYDVMQSILSQTPAFVCLIK